MGYAKATVLLVAFFCILAMPSSAAAVFGVSDFAVTARGADGTIDELAASHPSALDVHLEMNTGQTGQVEGQLRKIQVDLPPGLLADPVGMPRCPSGVFLEHVPSCPGSTQVGIFRGSASPFGLVSFPVYNLAPPFGSAVAFGIVVNGEPVVETLALKGSGASTAARLHATLPSGFSVIDVEEEIWGVPASSEHDAERICFSSTGTKIKGCPAGAEERPLLTLPATCSEPLRTSTFVSSADEPPLMATATSLSSDLGGNPRPLVGCEAIPFEPRFTATAESAALAPTAFSIDVETKQHEALGTVSSAPLSDLDLTLPVGFALNPAAGSWIAGCSADEIGLETAPGAEPVAFSESAADCPLRSRIGSLSLTTPLVDHDLSGAIYLAAPSANASGSQFALYLLIEDESTGTIVKMPAGLEADPEDGRLSVSLGDLPQVPFTELKLEFAGGPRAPLVSSASCGSHSTTGAFTPSTAPFEEPAIRSATLVLTTGPTGQPCPPAEAARGATPSFSADSEQAIAGGESAFELHLSRQDLDQRFGSFDLTLPEGLTANLGSVPLGAPVGSARVRAGVGPEPLGLEGTVYLEGPYKGAPYSLKVVVPAKVGPFDLGTIVQRAALSIDPRTAQISVRSDSLPQILDGVPLELRSLDLDLDRPGFIRNPTSCEPMTIAGTATTSIGQVAPISSAFQVGECAQLAFGPKLSVALSGAAGANGHPGLRATLRTDPSGAALKSASLTLPAGELLDLHHVRELCPRGVPVGQCPASSRLGSLRLQSPSLDAPLEGPVYMRVPSRRLPDLSADLSSGPLSFVLPGRTTDAGGRLGVSLESLPDIPLSSAVLNLAGGHRGILVNSRSLCGKRGHVNASFSAHNGMRRELRVPVRVDARTC